MAVRIVRRRDDTPDDCGFWDEIERRSGVSCPPKSTIGWVELMTAAGFTDAKIDSVLRELGFEGFDDAAELPRHWVSAPGKGENGNHPTFSARLLAGLRRNTGDRPRPDPPTTRADPPLSDNAVAILSELWVLKATEDNPQTRAKIAQRLQWEGEGKRAFNPLKQLGYVTSCRYGYYLTEAGKTRAQRLS